MPGLPVVGSAVDFARRMLPTQVRAMREVGDVVRFVVGPPGARVTLYAIYDAEGAHRVLAGAPARYRKDNRLYAEMSNAFGDGLLTSQDETWLRQKRLLQPLFTHAQVGHYVPAMAAEASALVERWRGRETVELHGETSRLTLRVVGRALLGADLDDAVGVLRAMLPALSEDLRRRGFSPFPTPPGWPTPANLRLRRHRAALDGVLDRLVAARRAAGRGDDLLGRLIAARDGDAALSDDEVRDQVLVFLFAGSDTTATALTAALHLLGAHPHVQDRARDEVRAVLGDREPTAAELRSLTYLAQVVKEALRLYPPAYATSRRLTGGDDEVAGHRIPDGADVGVYPWATHRHLRYWDDPERFDPDRFAPEREAARARYAWFPFGGGRRTCIGAHFAVLESLTVLAAVLGRYRLQTPDRPIPVVPKITLHPAGPVGARLTAL